ncbi:MAG TPA: AsmA family protein, partial [Puia sp.]|nr:AsmA family protein [Puia sp.]
MKNKILKITALSLLVIITFICAAPYLFKGKIISLVKAQINEDLRAHVNFSSLDISWFRHFPKIALGLDDLQVTCVGEFDGDTLVTAKRLDLGCGVASFISGDCIKIYSITLNDPHLHALVHRDGHSNWDILKSSAFSGANLESSSRPFKLEMERYAIHNGYISYEDERKDILVEMANLEHEGRGNFTSNLFTLKTKTTADAISF